MNKSIGGGNEQRLCGVDKQIIGIEDRTASVPHLTHPRRGRKDSKHWRDRIGRFCFARPKRLTEQVPHQTAIPTRAVNTAIVKLHRMYTSTCYVRRIHTLVAGENMSPQLSTILLVAAALGRTATTKKYEEQVF